MIAVVVARIAEWVHTTVGEHSLSVKKCLTACDTPVNTVDMASLGAPRAIRAAFDLGSGGIKVVVAEVAPVLGAAGQVRVTQVGAVQHAHTPTFKILTPVRILLKSILLFVSR